MIPDIKIKNYYLKFIYDAKADISNYKNKLNELNKIKQELISVLEENIDNIKKDFNLNLNTYTEWIDKKYNDGEALYQITLKLLSNYTDDKDRTNLLYLSKYCTILRNEDTYNKLIKLANDRNNINFKQYQSHVNKYYTKVHECALNGFGYKFRYGIGTFCISKWKAHGNKPILNFAETNLRKKELLKSGKKLYNKEDALEYKNAGIPYDGVEYKVYKNESSYYECSIINSRICKDKLEYQRTEYVHNKFRGLSYKEIADKFVNTIKDIYNLPVDIRYKLNILLYKYPTKYLNFIRTLDENKYKFR